MNSKLNYIKSLKTECPEGYEKTFMKAGGSMCPVCKKKAKKINKNRDGGEVEEEQSGVSSAMKGIKASLKCGGKTKVHKAGEGNSTADFGSAPKKRNTDMQRIVLEYQESPQPRVTYIPEPQDRPVVMPSQIQNPEVNPDFYQKRDGNATDGGSNPYKEGGSYEYNEGQFWPTYGVEAERPIMNESGLPVGTEESGYLVEMGPSQGRFGGQGRSKAVVSTPSGRVKIKTKGNVNLRAAFGNGGNFGRVVYSENGGNSDAYLQQLFADYNNQLLNLNEKIEANTNATTAAVSNAAALRLNSYIPPQYYTLRLNHFEEPKKEEGVGKAGAIAAGVGMGIQGITGLIGGLAAKKGDVGAEKNGGTMKFGDGTPEGGVPKAKNAKKEEPTMRFFDQGEVVPDKAIYRQVLITEDPNTPSYKRYPYRALETFAGDRDSTFVTEDGVRIKWNDPRFEAIRQQWESDKKRALPATIWQRIIY